VGVGVHQGSALGPLLFVMVVEALSGEFRVALPWELLCADGLVVVAETGGDLIERLGGWKDFVGSRGMRVGMNRAGVMISGERRRVAQKAVGCPCGVCGGGVGNNSIQCTSCGGWVHGGVVVLRVVCAKW